MKYNFIAYKKQSCDYARGCLVASYRSDFVNEWNLDKEILIGWWAKYLTFNATQLDHNEKGYVVTIYKDGQQLWDEWQHCGETCYVFSDETEEACIQAENLLKAEIQEIHEKAVAFSEMQVAEYEKEIADKKAEKEKQEAAIELEKKRKIYEQLKGEFTTHQ